MTRQHSTVIQNNGSSDVNDSLDSSSSGSSLEKPEINITTKLAGSWDATSADRQVARDSNRPADLSTVAAPTTQQQQLHFQGTLLFAMPTNYNKENKRTRLKISTSTENSGLSVEQQPRDDIQTNKEQKKKGKLTPEIIDSELALV